MVELNKEFLLKSYTSDRNVNVIFLTYKKIKKIVSNAFNGANLESLILNDNVIEEIDKNAFESLSNLKHLDLSRNRLRKVNANTFKELIKLERLELQHNEIADIDRNAFVSLSSLKILALNANKLKKIDEKCFEPLKSIESVLLYDNDFKALSYLANASDANKFYNTGVILENGYISKLDAFLEQFHQSGSQFHSPKLLIVDYYDSLIRDIDIYTEELLEKYNESDKEKRTKTSLNDYVSQVRSKAIKEINKCREENLDRFEIDKDKYKYDRENLTEEKVEEMRKELFKKRFCFVLRINQIRKNCNKQIFKLLTIVTDFYLDHYDLHKIKCFSQNCLKFYFEDYHLSKLIYRYINVMFESYGSEVISVSAKENLKKLERIEIIGRQINWIKIDSNLCLTYGFEDLSQLKSISIIYHSVEPENKIENLNLLKNLENLSIYNGIINQETFLGLNKLNELVLDGCDVLNDTLVRRTFSHLSSLRFLKFNYSLNNLNDEDFNLDWLNSFDNLNKLILRINNKCCLTSQHFIQLDNLSNLEHLDISQNEVKFTTRGTFSKLRNLRYLDMSRTTYNFYTDIFLGLDSLETLIIRNCVLNAPLNNKDTFNGLSSLKTLDLTGDNIESIDPEVFISTPMLTNLKLGENKCILDENSFSHLKNRIKKIELFDSDKDKIDPNALELFKRSGIDIINQNNGYSLLI